MGLTLSELSAFLAANHIPCEIEGDVATTVSSVATLDEAGEGQLSFLSNPKYEKDLATTKASAVLVRPEVRVDRAMNLLRTKDPYAAVTAAIVRLHGHRQHPQWGLSDRAVIAASARIGPNANIAPTAYIGEDVVIGAGANIYPGVYVAHGCRIGDGVILFPNVVIYEGCTLGNRVTIHAGSTVGQDGLGYAPVNDKWVKIPQIGHVIIGDDVEIGANCSIDRATLGSTIIGSGTKFSDLIAIGHGTKVGEDCMFVAQVGVAGSVTVGRHVTMAGQVGVAGHLTIGDNVTLGAKAGVANNVPAGSVMLGQPAVPINDCKRQIAVVQRLPEMKNELKQLRRDVERLLKQIEQNERSTG